MFVICCLLVRLAGVDGMALRAFSPGSTVQTGSDVGSFVSSCMGAISNAGLGCACARIGGQCRDPLSICDLTHHCKCDGSKGYLASSGTSCVAYATTTVKPIRCGNTFGYLLDELQEVYSEPKAISCVLMVKGQSTVLEQTLRTFKEDTDVQFSNRAVSCPGASSFQVEFLALSNQYCDDVILAIYDKILCRERGQALLGTTLTIPAAFFSVAFFVTDVDDASYRIRVACN